MRITSAARQANTEPKEVNAMFMTNGDFQQIVSAGAVALLVSACGTPGKNLPVTEGTAVATADGVQQITVKIESFYFDPSRIHVTVNKPARLILKSGTFLIPHNLSIRAPEAGIDVDHDIGHGDSTVVEFTPTKTGEYKIFCDKSGHAEKGMVGTLVVE